MANPSNPKHKVIVFDIDHTLVDTETNISESNIAYIRKFILDGWQIIFASGRDVNRVTPFCNAINPDYSFFIVSLNGGVIFDYQSKAIISEIRLSGLKVYRLFSEIKKFNLEAVAHCVDSPSKFIMFGNSGPFISYQRQYFSESCFEKYNSGKRYKEIYKLKVSGSTKNLNKLIEWCAKENLNVFRFTYRAPGWVEICPTGVDKKNSIYKVLQKIGFSWDQTISVGDSFNDFKMLLASSQGYLVQSRYHSLEHPKLITTKTQISNTAKVIWELIHT